MRYLTLPTLLLALAGCATSTLDAAAVAQNAKNVERIVAQNTELLDASALPAPVKDAHKLANQSALELARKMAESAQ